MRSRKAQLAEGAIFWIVYLTMTGIVIALFMGIPSTVYSEKTETHGMENAILNERVANRVAWQSLLTQRVYRNELPSRKDWNPDSIKSAFDTVGSPRQLGFKLMLDGQATYYNREFYERAKPLSPVRYQSFVEHRPVWIHDEPRLATLTIDQVFAPQPAGGG